MALSFYLSAGFGGSYVVYFPALARRLGSAAAAILLGRLIFLQTQTRDEQPLRRADAAARWVVLSLEDAAFETGLGLDELKSARRRLEAAGFIRVEYRRLAHELRWRVDLDQLDKIGEELSACFNAKVEKPLSGQREIHDGENRKENIDNVNDVFLKAVAAAATFDITSDSHPLSAEALCALAAANHRAKRDSNVSLSEQKIKQALAAASALADTAAKQIIVAVVERGGWLSEALADLKSAATNVARQQDVLLDTTDRLPFDASVAAAGALTFNLDRMGRRNRKRFALAT